MFIRANCKSVLCFQRRKVERHGLRILRVVVDVKNVGFHMIIPACVNAWTRAVNGFGGSINKTQQLIVLLMAVDIPGFIERAPADN